jgi:hypothetical protein
MLLLESCLQTVVVKEVSVKSRGSPYLSGSDVSIVFTLNIAVFWDVTRCIEVNTLWRFELSLDISTLKMKCVCSKRRDLLPLMHGVTFSGERNLPEHLREL